MSCKHGTGGYHAIANVDKHVWGVLKTVDNMGGHNGYFQGCKRKVAIRFQLVWMKSGPKRIVGGRTAGKSSHSQPRFQSKHSIGVIK